MSGSWRTRGHDHRANEEAAGFTIDGEGGVEAADEETKEQMSEEGRGSKFSFYYNWASRDETSSPPRDYAKRR